MKFICVSLPTRADRRVDVYKEFERVGIDVEFFDATFSPNGNIGLQITLLSLFDTYKNEDEIMIFEDDVMFTDDASFKIKAALEELPKDYDLLYLGATLTSPPVLVSKHLSLVSGALTAHAVLYHRTCYAAYMKHLRRVARQGYIATDYDISDVFLAMYQANHKCYMITPPVATQRPSYSDIQHKFVDYTNIINRWK